MITCRDAFQYDRRQAFQAIVEDCSNDRVVDLATLNAYLQKPKLLMRLFQIHRMSALNVV